MILLAGNVWGGKLQQRLPKYNGGKDGFRTDFL